MCHLMLSLTLWLPLTQLINAHVKVVQPVPYGASSLNTNPLEPSGSDWPCKQRAGVYDIAQWNKMAINSPQVLKFQGQATHGGGACQISLTRDTPPNKDSVFKVIKSIEGGCPSTNPGNVGTDPFGYGADEFNYTIPDTITPANYTLAWTWFNKIGEREMYMNCAPITVTPSSKKRQLSHPHFDSLEERADAMDALPDMFRANSGNGCSTAQSGTVLAIPEVNLGQNVQKIGSDALIPPVGNCGGGNAISANIASAAPNAPVASPLPSPTPIVASVPTIASSATTPPVVRMSPSSVASASPIAAITNQGLSTGTCPTPGKSVCSPDGKSWGTCMENYQVIYQLVAVGTKCDIELGTEVPE